MDGVALLNKAYTCGLQVSTDGEKLTIRGGTEHKPLVDLLIRQKADIIAALKTPEGTEAEITDAELSLWLEILKEDGAFFGVVNGNVVMEWAHGQGTPGRVADWARYKPRILRLLQAKQRNH